MYNSHPLHRIGVLMMNTLLSRTLNTALLAVAAAMVAGCSTPLTQDAAGASKPRPKEQLVAVTAAHELITFSADQPEKILERRALSGMVSGDRIVGIDFRVAKGVLYALTASGRLYTVSLSSGSLTAVGAAPLALRLPEGAVGFDFNPAADRIRVVSEQGLNMRLHPDSGVVVDGNPDIDGVQPDPALRYAWSDVNAGRQPRIAAAAYTYNPRDGKLTTNYAIDKALGVLVMQGSREGVVPVVSPNTGQLRTVGPLGLGPLADVSFDIADIDNAALAAVRAPGGATRLVRIDLETGAARVIGRVGDGSPVLGMAIEP